MQQTGLVYKTTSRTSGKSYVGQTSKKLQERIQGHVYSAKRGEVTHFARAIAKYGINDFDWEVVYDHVPLNHLDAYEEFAIGYFRTHIIGYNIVLEVGKPNIYNNRSEAEDLDKETRTFDDVPCITRILSGANLFKSTCPFCQADNLTGSLRVECFECGQNYSCHEPF